MKSSGKGMGIALITCICFLTTANGQVPLEIAFQGIISNGGSPVADGNYNLTFSLYTVASGGTAFWTEVHSGGNAVPVSDGIFNVQLGSITSLAGVAFDDQYFLGVKVGTDPEMSPRTPLLGVPYARALPNVHPTASSVSVEAPISIGGSDVRALQTLRGPDDREFGPVQFMFGDGFDQFESGRIRFVESTSETNWRGTFMHYDGAANKLHIGVHTTNDTLRANDVNLMTFERSSDPQVGIGTDSPNRELTINDTDADGDAYVNVTAGGQEIYLGIAASGQARLSVQTNTELRIRTNQSTRIAVTADGDTEIWDDLEVDGEIRTDANGDAMMVPRAWGTVASNGSMLMSSGNVTSSKSGTGSYALTLTEGCLLGVGDWYTAVATVRRGLTDALTAPAFVETIVNGETCTVGVETWELGVVTGKHDKSFSFIIFSP